MGLDQVLFTFHVDEEFESGLDYMMWFSKEFPDLRYGGLSPLAFDDCAYFGVNSNGSANKDIDGTWRLVGFSLFYGSEDHPLFEGPEHDEAVGVLLYQDSFAISDHPEQDLRVLSRCFEAYLQQKGVDYSLVERMTIEVTAVHRADL